MLLREQYELPHVSLTRAGRKLTRELLGEVRETAKPGVLPPDTWRALARLWEWDPTQERYLLADVAVRRRALPGKSGSVWSA